MSEGSNSSKYIVIGALLVILGVGGLLLLPKGPMDDSASSSATENVQNAADDTAVNAATGFDLQMALKDRVLGDPKAPIKISEHSSLTCSHCANFHKNTFKQFKEAYIDTGKVYLVFSDFPLNGPAVHASMVARCLPEDQYFDYVQELFETQEEWAFDGGYINALQKSSAERGLSPADFKSCLKSEELQKGLFEKLQAAKAQWNIAATPSFVINNRETISGARSFEEFSKLIDAELAKVQPSSGTPTPETIDNEGVEPSTLND